MADEHIGLSDHDLIVSMHTMLQQQHKTLYGNGQPGLVREQERIATQLNETRSDLERFTEKKVAELKAETPGKGTARLGAFSGVAGFVAAVVVAVYQAIRVAQ